MAYLRNTSGSYGIYRKFKDPVSGRQKEECLVRLGQWTTPEDALSGYSGRIKYLRKLVRDINRDRYHRHGYAARHERTLAQFEIERLLPKLAR